MSVSAAISRAAASLLAYTPINFVKSILLYVGILTHVRANLHPTFKPLHGVCEYLNALHIYADEARRGKVRSIETHHFCTHVRKDLRQCLLYDSCEVGARLIGIEYMIPKAKWETLPPEEQRLWHSHEFEVKSGMLVLPIPDSHKADPDAWEKLETEAMKEVVGLYGKTFHTWQVDVDENVPMGMPMLMGSLTGPEQIDVDAAMEDRNKRFGVDHRHKAKVRGGIQLPGVPDGADSWWEEAKARKEGIYAEQH